MQNLPWRKLESRLKTLNDPKKLFLVLSGPSGVGKSSFVTKVLAEYPQFCKLISCTTRSLRKSDEQEKAYRFLSQEEFKKKQEAGVFVEWAKVYGDYYGTDSNQIKEAWESKKCIIKDLDIQGGKAIKKAFPKEAVTIFIYPSSLFQLKERLIKRGTEAGEGLEKRLKEAENEISEGDSYDFKIINNDFEEAWLELKKIIESL